MRLNGCILPAVVGLVALLISCAATRSTESSPRIPSRRQLRFTKASSTTEEPDGEEGPVKRDIEWVRQELLKLLHITKWHPFVPHFHSGDFTRRPPPPWSYSWDQFPAYTFPQNASGMESGEQIEIDTRYTLVVIDGLHNVMNKSQSAERSLYEQCEILRQRNPSLVCMVYRQAWHALSNFEWSRTPALDPSTHPYWWVQQDDHQLYNVTLPQYDIWNLLFDWRNATSQLFYTQNTIGEVMAESNVIQGVFFDDFDGEGCLGALQTSLPSHYTPSVIMDMYTARIKMYSEVIKSLNTNGLVPILGMSSRFNTTANGCILPEEAVLDAMGDSVGFIREAIFDRTQAQTTPQGCAEFMRSTLEEVYSNIPTLFWSHTMPGGNLSSLSIPAFLIVRSDFSYFGASSGWDDSDWAWHSEYDHKYGAPLEQPQMSPNGMEFSRKYSNCIAILDCSRLIGCVDFPEHENDDDSR